MKAALLSLAAKVCKAAPSPMPHPAKRCFSSSSLAKPKAKAKAEAEAPPVAPAKEEKKTKRKGNTEAASKVVYRISSSLSSVVEVSETTRSDALKRMWDYIKARNLQNQLDKKEIVCDEKLKRIFGRDKVSIPEVLKLMNPHIMKKE